MGGVASSVQNYLIKTKPLTINLAIYLGTNESGETFKFTLKDLEFENLPVEYIPGPPGFGINSYIGIQNGD